MYRKITRKTLVYAIVAFGICVVLVSRINHERKVIRMSYTINGVFTSDAVNGKASGLYGDGTHDDSDILNSLLSGENKKIYLPSGTYIISKTVHIPDGVELFGDGERTVLKLASTFSLTDYTWRDESRHRTLSPIVYAHDNTSLKDFKIVGDLTEAKDQLQIGILINGDNVVCNNVSTENINYFPDAWGQGGYPQGYGANNACTGFGIFVFDAVHVRIYGGKHENCGYQAIGTDHATDVLVDGLYCGDSNAVGLQIHRGSKQVVFANCIVGGSENTNRESLFTIHGAEDDGWCEDLTISNCVLSGYATSFGFQSVWGFEKNVLITGCQMKSEKDGIFICRASHGGVSLGEAAKDFVITDNIIHAGSAGDGIKVNGDYCVVNNNIVHYGGTIGINVSGTNKIVENNLLEHTTN